MFSLACCSRAESAPTPPLKETLPASRAYPAYPDYPAYLDYLDYLQGLLTGDFQATCLLGVILRP